MERYLEERDALFSNGQDVQILTRFLRNLKLSNRRIAISICTSPSDIALIYGWKTFERTLGCPISLRFGGDGYQNIMRSLFIAAASANFKFTELSLFYEAPHGQGLASSLQMPTRWHIPLRSSWTSLTKLELVEFTDVWFSSSKTILKRLLSSAKQLEEFSLKGPEDLEETLSYWSRALLTKRLRKLALKQVTGNKDALISILERNKTSLRHVIIETFAIEDNWSARSRWFEVIEYIARHLRLDRLFMTKLDTFPGGWRLTNAPDRQVLLWDNTDSRQAVVWDYTDSHQALEELGKLGAPGTVLMSWNGTRPRRRRRIA
jgi:hypothetical protein